ncbi:hypothetical protein WJX73_009728 [Symbiochloris irregularis]|uniref:RecA family profile 1 domain-containing protein n=1 Tax=Symbiochloris irregularis TaxID=706552 RepID=A0AAW1Q4N9_9CHLO
MPRIENLNLALDPAGLAGLLSQYETVEAFLLRKTSARGSSTQAVEQLVAHIATHMAPKPRDGGVLHQELQDHARLLPTGCSSLDSLLHGGYREGHVTELWGPPASGKTQLCMLAAAVTATRGEGVVYMDTTASCSAALDSLSVSLQAQQGKQHRPRLLILDSASAVVAPILGGEGPANQGHALMCILGQQLRALARAYTLAVLVTNHSAGGGGGAQEPRPALG